MVYRHPLHQWATRLNRLILFHPSRWPRRELISRACALAIISGFLFLRISEFERFPQTFQGAQKFYGAFQTAGGEPLYSSARIAAIWGVKLLVWLIETGIFLGYIASYLSRARAVSVASGFMETWFPIIIAGIPVLMALAPYNLTCWAPISSASHIYGYLLVMGLIALGGLINLIGLWNLRRAFAIMSEARELITVGIFRYVRHPLYSGHFIMFLGTLLLRLHVYTVIMYAVFCCGQVARARIEERKISRVFPEYSEYKEKTGMFWPRW